KYVIRLVNTAIWTSGEPESVSCCLYCLINSVFASFSNAMGSFLPVPFLHPQRNLIPPDRSTPSQPSVRRPRSPDTSRSPPGVRQYREYLPPYVTRPRHGLPRPNHQSEPHAREPRVAHGRQPLDLPL